MANAALGLVAVQQGDLASARKQYVALQPARDMMVHYLSGDRLLGLLAHTLGQLDPAAAHFEDALAFCRRAGYRPELAWTCYDYAGLLLQRQSPGDRDKAASLLDEAKSLSSDLGMALLVERATTLQNKMETGRGDTRSSPAYPDGLTQREAEVLTLIAAGKSNSEIAQELVLSVRTVERHITNIYTKINARGRADATSYVLNHGLARGS